MKILWLTILAVILRIRLLYGQTEYSGKVVGPGEFPFVVPVVQLESIPPLHVICLGTVLSPNWVLTTAECIIYEKCAIKHGAWWANESQKVVPISDRIKHPKFAGDVKYCVGLLRAEYPIIFDSFTQPVRLVTQSKPVPINIQAFAIAWGSGEDLEVYNSTLLEQRTWNTFAVAPNFEYRNRSVGAPLMYNGDQIGILVSDNITKPFLYSDLHIHLDWIYRTINFYEFKEEYSYYKNVEPNCTGTTHSNDILDICCTYPFGSDLLELCTSLE